MTITQSKESCDPDTHLSDKWPYMMLPSSIPAMNENWTIDFSDWDSHTRSHWKGKKPSQQSFTAAYNPSVETWLNQLKWSSGFSHQVPSSSPASIFCISWSLLLRSQLKHNFHWEGSSEPVGYTNAFFYTILSGCQPWLQSAIIRGALKFTDARSSPWIFSSDCSGCSLGLVVCISFPDVSHLQAWLKITDIA